jgi:integrase
MRYAHACGLIGRDPTAGVSAAPKRRADDAPERVTAEMVPTRTEALAILAGTPAGYPAAAALGLAGLRIGECVGMRAEAVDRATRQVTVDQQAQPLTGHGMVLTTPKAERVRTITVPGLVAVELRRHLREHPTGILFAGPATACCGRPRSTSWPGCRRSPRPGSKAGSCSTPCATSAPAVPRRRDGLS